MNWKWNVNPRTGLVAMGVVIYLVTGGNLLMRLLFWAWIIVVSLPLVLILAMQLAAEAALGRVLKLGGARQAGNLQGDGDDREGE